MLRRWNPDAIASPIGMYSHLAHVPPGHELVLISGQVGAREDGVLDGDTAAAQTAGVLKNVERLLEAAGASPSHLVKIFSMVAGTEHLTGFRGALKESFAQWFPDGDWPTQSLVVVTALARPDILVEIEAMAAVPR